MTVADIAHGPPRPRAVARGARDKVGVARRPDDRFARRRPRMTRLREPAGATSFRRAGYRSRHRPGRSNAPPGSRCRRDLARFGRASLDRGRIGGEPVFPAGWIDRIHQGTTRTVRDRPRRRHGEPWRVTGPGAAFPAAPAGPGGSPTGRSSSYRPGTGSSTGRTRWNSGSACSRRSAVGTMPKTGCWRRSGAAGARKNPDSGYRVERRFVPPGNSGDRSSAARRCQGTAASRLESGPRSPRPSKIWMSRSARAGIGTGDPDPDDPRPIGPGDAGIRAEPGVAFARTGPPNRGPLGTAERRRERRGPRARPGIGGEGEPAPVQVGERRPARSSPIRNPVAAGRPAMPAGTASIVSPPCPPSARRRGNAPPASPRRQCASREAPPGEIDPPPPRRRPTAGASKGRTGYSVARETSAPPAEFCAIAGTCDESARTGPASANSACRRPVGLFRAASARPDVETLGRRSAKRAIMPIR